MFGVYGEQKREARGREERERIVSQLNYSHSRGPRLFFVGAPRLYPPASPGGINDSGLPSTESQN